MAHEDKVTLNGQDYLVKGPVVGKPVAEFEVGFKVGKATYDQRENAFFLVMDDFSGGFGRRRTDINEDLGTFWDVDDEDNGMPDATRAGHIILPVDQGAATLSANPTANNMTIRTPSYPHQGPGLVGIGSAIYTSADGATFTRRDAGGADAGQVQAIIQYVCADGTVINFAGYSSAAEAIAGTARYKKSTDAGVTWANGATDKVLHDMFVWDGKIIAAYGRSIIFTTMLTNSAAEEWNVDAATDGEFITSVSAGHIHFIGVAPAPWGEPAVYFTNEGYLAVLDFFARKHYVIDIGVGGLCLPCMYSGNIAVTDGWNVFLYDPGGKSVRNIGFPRRDGVVPSLHGAGGDLLIRALFALDDRLYAIVSSGVLNKTLVFVYNGSGWQLFGKAVSDMFANFGLMGAFPPSGFQTRRRIYVGGAATTTSTTVKLQYWDQPHLSGIPAVGVDSFGASGAAFITGWIDGGFSELDGALFRMHCDGWSLSSTSTVKVEYQLDNAESSAWVQMRNSSNVAAVFTATTDTLYFSASDPLKGIQFRTVRFRITLTRGGTATQSPELRALTLVYYKKPGLRTAWTFDIDVNRMIAEGTLVGGSAATMQNVWEALVTAWNVKPLISFEVPNVKTGMRVLLTDMPITVDDLRDAVDGRGAINVTVLEPVL